MIALLSSAAWAAFPSSPPTAIDDAETVDAGHTEINLTLGAVGGNGAFEAEAPLVDANLGVLPNVHVNAEIPLVFARDGGWTVGLGRAAAAVKLRFVHTDAVQLAIHPEIELPPLPSVSVDAAGASTLTLPLVADVALGKSGVGLGLQLSRSFGWAPEASGWGAAVGVAGTVGELGDAMAVISEEAGANLALASPWVELGLVHERLFGSEHLALLAAAGASTDLEASGLLGVQLGF